MSEGRYGKFGGRYIPETLVPAIDQLEKAFEKCRKDNAFLKEFKSLREEYAGRPTPLTYAENLSEKLGVKVYLKREDLLHTGAHKINNALGQALLAKYMGKERVIAETGAGQHGTATAIAAAKLGLECDIYMGEKDMERQKPNVHRMKLAGANVTPVSNGSKTLKDAINECMRDWVGSFENTHYLLGSALGPHPYPALVAFFHKVIGDEARRQIEEKESGMPKAVIACIGGGSNAIGIFKAFLEDDVDLIGVEAGGKGVDTGKHAARFGDEELGKPGVMHGTHTYMLQDEHGQIFNTHSISAGLDYSAVGPEHADLKEKGRAKYVNAEDDDVLRAFKELSKTEGIIPALESSHALAYLEEYAESCDEDDVVIINLSGRGDKDLGIAVDELGEDNL